MSQKEQSKEDCRGNGRCYTSIDKALKIAVLTRCVAQSLQRFLINDEESETDNSPPCPRPFPPPRRYSRITYHQFQLPPGVERRPYVVHHPRFRRSHPCEPVSRVAALWFPCGDACPCYHNCGVIVMGKRWHRRKLNHLPRVEFTPVLSTTFKSQTLAAKVATLSFAIELVSDPRMRILLRGCIWNTYRIYNTHQAFTVAISSTIRRLITSTTTPRSPGKTLPDLAKKTLRAYLPTGTGVVGSTETRLGLNLRPAPPAEAAGSPPPLLPAPGRALPPPAAALAARRLALIQRVFRETYPGAREGCD